MRDIIQKSNNTDKRITIALRRSVWLSYLLSLGAISAGGLSLFSVAAVLGAKPAQADMKEQTTSLPAQSVEDQQALPTNSQSSKPTYLREYHQDLVNISGQKSPLSAKQGGNEGQSKWYVPSGDAIRLVSKPGLGTSNQIERKQETLQTLGNKEQNNSFDTSVSTAVGHTGKLPVELSSSGDTQVYASEYLGAIEKTGTPYGVSTEARSAGWKPQAQDSRSEKSVTSVERNAPEQLALGDEPTTVEATKAPSKTAVAPVINSVEHNSHVQLAAGDEATTVEPTNAPSGAAVEPAMNSVERNLPTQLAEGDKPTTVAPAKAPSETETAPAVYSGPGGAALLGGTIQAQTTVEDKPAVQLGPQNSPQEINPLAPTLRLQGAYIYQGESSARARLTGLYPFSTNALVGGTLDLTTGDGFSNAPGGGLQLQLNELYFTGSLPSMPNLRMTVGLIDLTSYFDRNSFAKDAETHFFNPVFQTNPALAAAGIGSRPGILLNWDITDDLQARAAAFSSHRNLGDFAIDAFAGEVAYRAGNAIIRGTVATDRDAGRNNGFKEIYGIPRDDDDFGLRSGDREIAYGINGEYYIPEIKMGLFGRYGRYENTTLGEGGDTFSLGFNFLDLFMRDDRLGFGYGRDLSNNGLRRELGNKVPDVWELFYDFRISRNLRAGVTLQARDAFSDIVAGFRVRTDFDLTSLGRLFR